MKSFIRTKTCYCGTRNASGKDTAKKAEYLEADLFPYMAAERILSRKRKEKLSIPKQRELNRRNAKKAFRRLIKHNFTELDIHLTLTYSKDFLPKNIIEAEKEVRNFLRRLARLVNKENLPELRYMYLTEKSKTGRIHHHIIMSGGLDRDVIEKAWSKKGVRMGHANADRLRLEGDGLDALAEYLAKDPKGRRRWSASKNIQKPEITTSDTKVSKSRFYKISELPEDSQDVKEFFERLYPGYEFVKLEKYYNDVAGTYKLSVGLRLKRGCTS